MDITKFNVLICLGKIQNSTQTVTSNRLPQDANLNKRGTYTDRVISYPSNPPLVPPSRQKLQTNPTKNKTKSTSQVLKPDQHKKSF
uniref:Uncharacterized protein n=1 Tax=Arion vulgaris TaxID=1028688 RepID=A0A0B6YJU9_9EUPU